MLELVVENNGKRGKKKMAVVSMRKMLENGVHFGHQTRKWNPKMKPYIYTQKNGLYILDLEQTREHLEKAYAEIKKIVDDGGKVLFVGTKKQAQATILEEALRSGSFYINQRWLGGTLTNFRTIQKSIKRLVEIEQMEESDTIKIYTKKEQAALLKKKAKLDNFLGGIKEMKKLPDAVFVVDPLEEHNAVAEAKKLGIPVFALIDTNADPDTVDYPIPCNDDSLKSVKLLVSIIADAVVESKGGVREVAYMEEEGDDISMDDVIRNVEEQAAEYEKKKRQKFEERRQAMAQKRFTGERRVYKKDAKEEAKEEVKEEAAVEEVAAPEAVVKEEAPVVEEVVATEVVEEVKAEEESE